MRILPLLGGLLVAVTPAAAEPYLALRTGL
jgi:hypothetical protein